MVNDQEMPKGARELTHFPVLLSKNSRTGEKRPTQRAPDGWWAPQKKRIQTMSYFRFAGWFSQPPVTQTVGQPRNYHNEI